MKILTNLIIDQYFRHLWCIVIFTDSNNSVYNSDLSFLNIRVDNGTFDAEIFFGYHGCQGFIINVKQPLTLITNIETLTKRSLERFNNRRYLIIPEQDADENPEDIDYNTILKFISDLVIVKTVNCSLDVCEYFLITHTFGEETENMILLDEWNSSTRKFKMNNNLYPNKLQNCKGVPITIATFNYKPYSVPDFNDGVEFQLAIEFSKRHNLSLKLLIDDEGEWGELFTNWTGFGIMGNLLADKSDVALAALYTWENSYIYLDLTKPFIRTGVTCLVPAPKLAGGWFVPFLSFSYQMWTAFGLSFLFCVGSKFWVNLIQYKLYLNTTPNTRQIFSDTAFNTATVFLSQSVADSIYRNNIKKIIYACIFIFSLLIGSCYSSGLSSIMTVPRYVGAIKTVEDLIGSGIQWGATSIAWLMSIWDSQEERFIVLKDRFVKTDEERLTFSNDKRFGFAIERLSGGYFAIGEYITEEGVNHLRLMSEDIYWEYCVLMTRKSSIWTPVLDDFILKLAQSGIPSYWEYRVATTFLNANIQRAIQQSRHHSEGEPIPIKLQMGNVEGAFALWFMGMVLALVCFIYEFLFKNSRPSDIIVI